MSAEILRRKGLNALATARASMAAGDHDAAVNRAYYAIFDIARAALAVEGALDLAHSRKHKTVLAGFSEHFVKSGRIERRFGAEINAAFEARAVADYDGTMMESAHARTAVTLADEFIKAVDAALERKP